MSVKGQVILIMVFALTFALFSIFMLLAPIKDKLLRIKDLESVYQAIANSEKGLEASLLDIFQGINLQLTTTTVANPPLDCGGLNPNLLSGTCYQVTFEPIFGSGWEPEDKFIANGYFFVVVDSGGEMVKRGKTISDGFEGKNIRTSLIGSTR
jgi:hypothetical protein